MVSIVNGSESVGPEGDLKSLEVLLADANGGYRRDFRAEREIYKMITI
jgi:hypothetical protein